MEIAGFSVFDVTVLGLLFLGALFGLVLGFVRGGLFVASWVGAGLVTIYGFERVFPIAEQYIDSKFLAQIVAGAALFIVALIVFHLIGHILSGWVRSGRLNALDRSLGLLAGLATAAAVVCAAYLFMGDDLVDDAPEWIETARTRPAVERGALLVRDLLPADVIGNTGAALEKARRGAKSIDAVREAVDQLASPPETPAQPAEEGYKDGTRESIDNLIRKAQ